VRRADSHKTFLLASDAYTACDVRGDDLSGAGKGGRGKVAESAKFPIHPETLSKARAVLTFSRPLAKAVRDGSWASEG
jgi:hypothetical protein